MIQPHELFPTAIVNINGLPTVISGILPPEPREDERFNNKWVVMASWFNTPLEMCEPIHITEKILTEWCGFDVNDKFNFLGHFGIGKNSKGVYCLLYSNEFCVNLFEGITFEYLHVLQRFYLDFKNEPLKITLK